MYLSRDDWEELFNALVRAQSDLAIMTSLISRMGPSDLPPFVVKVQSVEPQ